MKIYIASSWKNQHGVEMLTSLLRAHGHEVISWVENNFGENHNHVTKKFSFEEWVTSDEAMKSFDFDTIGAMTSDLVIYYAPSGKDAATECGMAFAKGVPVIGLFAKGEDYGLMRRMMTEWYYRYPDLLAAVNNYRPKKQNPYNVFKNSDRTGGRKPHRMDYESTEEFDHQMNHWINWEGQNNGN